MPVRGPRLKVLRRLGVQLPGLTRKVAERRPHPPGAHGTTPARRRKSAYRLRLEEKQKLRANYGVTEGQLRRYVAAARARAGHTGANLLALLERRLDNVVFRLGLAPTIPAARQLVAHGHVAVNGARVDRAGRLVAAGDVVALTPEARRRPALCAAAEAGPVLRLPSHLAAEPGDGYAGRVLAAPARSDVPFPVDDALIVEFYAR
ncbi:MAG TPA: 30S ribosomal protein S4 [Gemmatimonadales bacterium]|nr:30S ribosomal protein S4 [Gemmatimonadales bacterium]